MAEYNNENSPNKKPKYKLSRLKKTGIAIGLTLALITTACTGGIISIVNEYSPSSYSTVSTTNNTNTINNESTITKDYIDVLKSNEFKVYDENSTTTQIVLNNYNFLNFTNTLNNSDYTFDMAKYYGLTETLELYKTTEINKSTNSNLLDSSGNLDPTKLMQQVQENNKNYMAQGKNSINAFYTDLSTSEISKICTLIAEVVNSKFNNLEINKVANTLTQLTMFERTGSASNAYITNNLTFVYNPTMTGMYADVKQITGEHNSEEDTLKSVIVHEIMHLIEYSASDNNNENGIETGICRMYNVPMKEDKVPVDSLWNSWILEAAAELGMADYLNIKPGTYEKKISYARAYNLSRFNDLNLETQGIEDVAFNHNLEEAFKDLEINTIEEQEEFLKFMYSVEITQTNPDDFWKNYTKLTGQNPTEQEKTAIRMDIRTDAVKYLTRNFYQNLADAIYEGNVTDINTTFYLIRNWEIDTYNHLEYTKTTSLPHAQDFILWHDQIQNSFFTALAESNGLTQEQVLSMYDEYNLQVSEEDRIYDNCNLSRYSDYTQTYITSAKENYSTANYSRNSDMKDYINSNNKKYETYTK